nr:hypothetical protein [Phenylobacterium aquaticum]
MSAWALGLEATTVIGLRTAKIAAGGRPGGGVAPHGVGKLAAAWALQLKAATGALGPSPASATARTLAHYRRAVRANRRRLQRA